MKKRGLLFVLLAVMLCLVLTACGDKGGEGEHTHSFGEYKPNYDATCMSDGTKTAWCDCGEEDAVVDEGSMLFHRLGELAEYVPATCEYEGVRAHYQCDMCLGYFDEIKTPITDISLPLASHYFDEHSDVHEISAIVKDASRCLYEISYEGGCALCHTTVRLTESIEKHTFFEKVTTPATCQSEGAKDLLCGNDACRYHNSAFTQLTYGDGAAHTWEVDQSQTTAEVVVYHCADCKQTKRAVTGNTLTVSPEQFADMGEVTFGGGLTMRIDESTREALGGESLTISAEVLSETQKSEALSRLSQQDLQKTSGAVYDFTMEAGGAPAQPNGCVVIRIPYQLEDKKNCDRVVIWYISEKGLEPCQSKYIEENGEGWIEFETNHFSFYTAGEISPAERCRVFGHDIHNVTEYPATCQKEGYGFCSACGQRAYTIPITYHRKDQNGRCEYCGEIIPNSIGPSISEEEFRAEKQKALNTLRQWKEECPDFYYEFDNWISRIADLVYEKFDFEFIGEIMARAEEYREMAISGQHTFHDFDENGICRNCGMAFNLEWNRELWLEMIQTTWQKLHEHDETKVPSEEAEAKYLALREEIAKVSTEKEAYEIITRLDCFLRFGTDPLTCSHRYELDSESRHNCLAEGIGYYRCSVCGYCKEETLPPYEDHLFIGNSLICERCGDKFDLNDVYERIENKLHSLQGYLDRMEPEYHSQYSTQYHALMEKWHECRNDRDTLYADLLQMEQEINAFALELSAISCPHNRKHVLESKTPTCTEAGYTVYHCDDCGENVREEQSQRDHWFTNGACIYCGKPSKGDADCDHSYVYGRNSRDITELRTICGCDAPYSIYLECEKCGFERTIDCYGEHEINDGRCIFCDRITSSKIPETCTHTPKVLGEIQPTCYDEGAKLSVCYACNFAYVEYYPSLNHHFVEGVCTLCDEKLDIEQYIEGMRHVWEKESSLYATEAQQTYFNALVSRMKNAKDIETVDAINSEFFTLDGYVRNYFIYNEEWINRYSQLATPEQATLYLQYLSVFKDAVPGDKAFEKEYEETLNHLWELCETIELEQWQ